MQENGIGQEAASWVAHNFHPTGPQLLCVQAICGRCEYFSIKVGMFVAGVNIWLPK